MARAGQARCGCNTARGARGADDYRSLAGNGWVEVTEETLTEAVPTEAGKEAAVTGTPERQLLLVLDPDPAAHVDRVRQYEPMLDIVTVSSSLGDGIAGELEVSGVVVQVDGAIRPEQVAENLTVVATTGKQVDDHRMLTSVEKAQHLCRLACCIPLPVSGRPA